MKRHRARVVVGCVWLSLVACKAAKNAEPTVEPAQPPAAAPSPATLDAGKTNVPAVADAAAPAAGLEIEIPKGAVHLGSETGSAHRNPAREADHVSVDVASYTIDALPYPNDPDEPPKRMTSRAEASALCAAQGKRLCSEIEWERACKGDDDSEYPGRDAFDADRCAREPTACGSTFGVHALGTLGREWTASDAARGEWDGLRTAVVRGAAKDAPPALHRCAARDAATPDSRSDSLIFRCCRGAAPAGSYPVPSEYPPFREGTLDDRAISAALSAMPETRATAAKFRRYGARDLGEALTRASRSQSSLAPWQAIQGALLWSPVRGEEIVVVSGDTPEGALVVAYYPLGEGRVRFAGSYHTKGEHIPVLVAYKSDARAELLFSTCWGCGGEGGAIQLAEDARLRFVPR